MEGRDGRGLLGYLWVVTLLAAPLVGLVTVQALGPGVPLPGGRLALVVVLFSVILIAGEMWPIPVARGDEAGDEITVSSTFGLALLLLAPVFYPIAAQAVALVIDWRVRDRRWHRLPFNVAQYALAFLAARLVYALAAGEPFTPSPELREPQLLSAVLAGAAFLLVNNGLVGVAVAARVRMKLWRVLVQDVTWQLMTSAPLLGLAPLAAQAVLWSPLSIVLLLIPIAALHHSGRTAMVREQEALRDPLTGLANRTLLTTSAEKALRDATQSTALLLIDLDHFKDVNDTLGHGVGDELLLAVAERLRQEAGPTDVVARLGGDEFVVLVRSCDGAAAAVELAERLSAAIGRPFPVQGVVLTVGCSLGIGLAPEHVGDVQGLLRCADVALYTAKEVRGTWAVYDRDSDRHSAALLGLQADLRAALEDPDDLQVHVVHQPQLDLATGRVRSVESLVRWQHPQLGLLLPDQFVAMAESTSLIDLLLRRVLDLALAQAAAWAAAGTPVSVAVNLSARQLIDLALPDAVGRCLAAHGVAPERLVLEVTESRLMSDPERSATILGRLQAMGVEISVDDFGTGYSSLAYLQRLDVDELKIDKSFTTDLRGSGATIVKSTIELGHNLGLRVVAEGVEDQATGDLLAAMGCDVLQGYAIGRPGTPADLDALLGRPHPAVASADRARLAALPVGAAPVAAGPATAAGLPRCPLELVASGAGPSPHPLDQETA